LVEDVARLILLRIAKSSHDNISDNINTLLAALTYALLDIHY